MTVAEKIYEQVQNLPESIQAKVLDFIGHLEAKSHQHDNDLDHPTESEIAIVLAMRGMEDEDTPEYGHDDLKEVF
jgi:hypothetical protein